jgi:hypothetical protein
MAFSDDMATTEIDGADFFESSNLRYVRRTTIHTPGSRFLATISEGSDNLFRVDVFTRSRDHQYPAEFWGSLGDPSLTDSLEAAQALARARLKTLDG